MKQKYLAIILALIVIAAGAYFYINKNNTATAPEAEEENINIPPSEGAENNTPTDTNSNTAGNVPTTADTIIITEQAAGSYVTVDNLNLSKPGFVVIHENNNGQVGAAVGYSGYLSAGTKQDLEVKANIVAGRSYFAELHWDNGDKKLNAAVDPSAYKVPFTVSK